MKRAPQLASKHECIGCMACVGVCHAGALTMQIGGDGHGYPVLDTNKCVQCLRCEHVCKGTWDFIGNNQLQKSTPYAAWADDEKVRSHSTSGGFAAAVSQHFIETGNGVVGAAFDGWNASHIYINNVEDAEKLQGSKYVWSDASAVYKVIAEKLAHQQVLFIGTGCQVAGMLSCFAHHPHRENLYTIDLVCGGVPSHLLMQVYRDAHPEVEAITSFRTKRRYELKGIVNQKEVVLQKPALPLSGFGAEQTMRYSCYDCPFAYVHRCSDVTIGDLWGEAAPAEQTEKGVSLVVVHSERGLKLLKELKVTTQKVEWDKILDANMRLVFGRTSMTRLRRCLEKNYHRMSNETFTRVYGNSSTPKHPVGFAWRLWIWLLRKCNDRAFLRLKKQLVVNA